MVQSGQTLLAGENGLNACAHAWLDSETQTPMIMTTMRCIAESYRVGADFFFLLRGIGSRKTDIEAPTNGCLTA